MSLNNITGDWYIHIDDANPKVAKTSTPTIIKFEANNVAKCSAMGKYGKYSFKNNMVLLGFTDGFNSPTHFYLFGKLTNTPDGDVEIQGIIGSPNNGIKSGRFAASRKKIPTLPEQQAITVTNIGGLTIQKSESIDGLSSSSNSLAIYQFTQGKGDYKGTVKSGVVSQTFRWDATYASYKFSANSEQLLVFSGNSNRLYGGIVNGNQIEKGMWVYGQNEGSWG